MKARFTRRSLRQLANIRAWIATHRPLAAELVRGRILASVDTLCALPRLGHPGRRPATRELTVAGLPYVIVYRIDIGDRDELVVLGIFHAAQDR
jgi:toxin ParE1/3/4